jgi:hypothetical protein
MIRSIDSLHETAASIGFAEVSAGSKKEWLDIDPL